MNMLEFTGHYFQILLNVASSQNFIELQYQIQKMNLDMLDPNWQSATNHGKASKVGYPVKNQKEYGSVMVCSCCHRYINKEPIPICDSSKELDIIGFGFPLYEHFIRDCLILLFLSICSYNMLALYTSIKYNQTYCDTLQGKSMLLSGGAGGVSEASKEVIDGAIGECWTFMVRMANISKDVSSEEQLTRVVSWVLQFFWLIYMRDKLDKLESYYNERTCSISDYSIIIKNIPKQMGIQKKMREFFNNQFRQPYEIKQLTLLQDADHFRQLKSKKKQIINKLRKYYKNQDFESEGYIDLKNDLKEADEELRKRANQIKVLAENDEILTEKIILVFDSQKIRNNIISEFDAMKENDDDREMLKQYFGDFKVDPTIKVAPEPTEIYWGNINVPKRKRMVRTIVSWFLSAVVLFILTVIVYLVFHKKSELINEAYGKLEHDPKNAKYQSEVNWAITIVYAILIFIMLFNKLIMSHIFHKITDLQKNETSFKFQLSFQVKYCLGLFFTTAVMTLIVEGIQEENYYRHIYGVIDEETIMFFFVLVFIPVFWIINPFHIMKVISRKLHFGARYFTQKQANKLMEDTPYDLGKRYAEVIEIIWFTYLYATLIPFGAFASFLGLVLLYWIDKFNLLRRSSITHDVSGRLVQASLTLLDVSLIMKPIGELIFDERIRHDKFEQTNISSLICLIIGVMYVILPSKKIIQHLDHEKFHEETRTYTEMKNSFKDTYHSCHPIYSFIHQQKILMQLRDFGVYLDTQRKRQQTEKQLMPPPF